MPDNLTKCVSHEGKTYCWDLAAETIVEVKITEVPLDQVPKDVLVAMLNDTAQK